MFHSAFKLNLAAEVQEPYYLDSGQLPPQKNTLKLPCPTRIIASEIMANFQVDTAVFTVSFYSPYLIHLAFLHK